MMQYVGLQYANMYNLAGATVYVIVNSTCPVLGHCSGFFESTAILFGRAYSQS